MEKSQVHTNHDAYNENFREELERDHPGRVALMHKGEVVGIYDTHSAAYWVGCERYELGNFSIEWIGARPAHLGIITAALQ